MQALQIMTGQGGWPLNIFLTTRDLVPFYGGTYFPVTPRYNRPSFIDILKSVRRFYDKERKPSWLFGLIQLVRAFSSVRVAVRQTLFASCAALQNPLGFSQRSMSKIRQIAE